MGSDCRKKQTHHRVENIDLQNLARPERTAEHGMLVHQPAVDLPFQVARYRLVLAFVAFEQLLCHLTSPAGAVRREIERFVYLVSSVPPLGREGRGQPPQTAQRYLETDGFRCSLFSQVRGKHPAPLRHVVTREEAWKAAAHRVALGRAVSKEAVIYEWIQE